MHQGGRLEKITELQNTKQNQLKSLQGVRALAFAGIFSSHCGCSDLGAWGVSVFFILSGFLMVYNCFFCQKDSEIISIAYFDDVIGVGVCCVFSDKGFFFPAFDFIYRRNNS